MLYSEGITIMANEFILPSTGNVFVSTIYDSQKKTHISYCSGDEFAAFLRDCIKARLAALPTDETNHKIHIKMYGGGNLYLLNTKLAREKDTDLGKNIPLNDRSQFNMNNKAALQSEATAGLDNDIRWVNQNVTGIYAAINQAFDAKELQKWNIHVTAPIVDKTNKQNFKVNRQDFQNVLHPNVNKDENPHSITIEFFTWTELYAHNKDAYINKLAKIFAYYYAGEKIVQKYTPDDINDGELAPAGLSKDIWKKFTSFNINLLNLGNAENKAEVKDPFTLEDLEFICLELKIDFEKFKVAFTAARKENINPDAAQASFIKTNLAAFDHFSRSSNGGIAQGLTPASSTAVNQAFLATVSFMLSETAGFNLASEEAPALYPKPMDEEPIQQNLSAVATAVFGKPIDFQTKKIIAKPLPANNVNVLIHAEHLYNKQHRLSEGSTGSLSGNIDEKNNPGEASGDRDDLLQKFTGILSTVVSLVCPPPAPAKGILSYYNTELAIIALNKIIAWNQVLNIKTSGCDNLLTNADGYQKLDREFWGYIKSIAQKVNDEFSSPSTDEEKNQKSWVQKVYDTADNYLTDTEVQNKCFHSTKTFKSTKTLQQWAKHVKEELRYKPITESQSIESHLLLANGLFTSLQDPQSASEALNLNTDLLMSNLEGRLPLKNKS